MLTALAMLACGRGGSVEAAAPATAPAAASPTVTKAVERLRVEVVASYPHDRSAFTQGLVWTGRELFESTGLYGQSSLRRVELETGEVLAEAALPSGLFAEGLALKDGTLVQLTWQEGKALLWKAPSFQPLGDWRYDGEGWGLCFDGRRFVMSDGSESLAGRDPETFAETGRTLVTRDGLPVPALNELECVGDAIYANVWTTDEIVRIDAASGRVTATIDASGLLSAQERVGSDVLNGIAYRAEKETFLLTGKHWPRLFEVRFVPAG